MPPDLLPPRVSATSVQWRLPRSLAPDGIRLEVDWVLAGNPEFAADGDWWTFRLDRPAANRIEYRLDLRGGSGLGPDPSNPVVLPDPFGDRSEIRFPDYRPPGWLGAADTGHFRRIEITPRHLDRPVPVGLWSPPGLPDEAPAPLLLANDGSALAERGSMLVWASAYAARRPLRVALLDPADGCRDAWYGANPDYLAEVADVVVPTLREQVAVERTVGLGISLGGLATLLLHRQHPGLLAGVALQSGSFFTPALDGQEAGYARFDAVCAAVAGLTDPPQHPIPALLTCGAIEENLANNEAVARRLAAADYELRFVIVPDAHTMIGWRDAWSPHLDELIDRLA